MQYFFWASAAQALHQLETKRTICMPTHTFTVIFSTYQQLIMNVLRKLLSNIILIYLFYSWPKWNLNDEEVFLEHQKEPFERWYEKLKFLLSGYHSV